MALIPYGDISARHDYAIPYGAAGLGPYGAHRGRVPTARGPGRIVDQRQKPDGPRCGKVSPGVDLPPGDEALLSVGFHKDDRKGQSRALSALAFVDAPPKAAAVRG